MEQIYDCLIHKHGLAFGIGTVTLLLTIFLVSRHIIGFTLSLILMLIGLGASYGIEHQDVVKSYWFKTIALLSPKAGTTTESTTPAEQPSKAINQTTGGKTEGSSQQPDVQHLKGQTQRQKERANTFIDSHVPAGKP